MCKEAAVTGRTKTISPKNLIYGLFLTLLYFILYTQDEWNLNMSVVEEFAKLIC